MLDKHILNSIFRSPWPSRPLAQDRGDRRKAEQMSNVFKTSIHMEACEHRHGSVHHAHGLGNDQSSPLETAVPMALSSVVLLQPPGLFFSLEMSADRKRMIVRSVGISAIEYHFPSLQPIQQPGQSVLVTIAAFPVNQLACITTISFPDPEFIGLFLR